MDLKPYVGAGKRVRFVRYADNCLWYVTDNGFEFPVPTSDTGTGVFLAEDKAILFMRYVRKHLEYLSQARLDAGLAV